MIRALLISAVALDEIIVYNDRHGSTDSGVFDERPVIYNEDGEIIQQEEENILVKPGIVGDNVPTVENVNSKGAVRSELQELLLEEEEAMVKLSQEVEQTAFDEERIREKLGSSNGEMRDAHNQQNGHQIPNPTDGLLGFDDDGEVVITEEGEYKEDEDDDDDEVNGFGHSEEEVKMEDEHTASAEKDFQKDSKEEVVADTQTNTPVGDGVQATTEIEKAPKLRRSTREKKSKSVAKEMSGAEFFKDLNLKTSFLEGHHHDVCSVDMYEKFAVSGGRDTSLKLWDAVSSIELQSLGGHEGTITCVRFMTDKPFETTPPVLTASSDCSLRLWSMDAAMMTKSIYVYSPVTCLDYSNGLIAIGTEGGKVEVFDSETGNQQFTVNAYEEVVTSVKFLSTNKIACGSVNGVVQLFDTSIEDKTPIFKLDPETIKVSTKAETTSVEPTTSGGALQMSKVNCMAVYDDLIIYGDNGYNIKVLDYRKGQLTKVCNNLKEFCPTEALHIATVQSQQYLFSVGSDVDNGDAYINIRSLPDLQYIGTIRDIETNSGSITSLSLQDINKRVYFVTGGAQLRAWNQISRRGRKRKGSPNGDLSVVPCKYICNFTDVRDSEPESETETEPESRSDDNSTEQATERIPADAPNSWCTIL